MDTIYRQIGEHIRAARIARSKTQAEISEVAGIDESFFGQIERGVAVPSIKTLVGVAKALDVDVRDLFPSSARPDAFNVQVSSISAAISALSEKDRAVIIQIVSTLSTHLSTRK